MTSPSPAALAAPEQPQTPVVNPEPNSRLDQLAAEYALLKPQLEELTELVKGLTDGIKRELSTAHPTATDILLTSPHLRAPLQLQAVTSWRLDSKTLKTDQPETWVRYAKQSTAWRLAPLAS